MCSWGYTCHLSPRPRIPPLVPPRRGRRRLEAAAHPQRRGLFPRPEPAHHGGGYGLCEWTRHRWWPLHTHPKHQVKSPPGNCRPPSEATCPCPLSWKGALEAADCSRRTPSPAQQTLHIRSPGRWACVSEETGGPFSVLTALSPAGGPLPRGPGKSPADPGPRGLPQGLSGLALWMPTPAVKGDFGRTTELTALPFSHYGTPGPACHPLGERTARPPPGFCLVEGGLRALACALPGSGGGTGRLP